MTQQAMKLETSQSNNVPLRQFSLYRPPYEELYTFWWKCMQITLHDKGTQTLTTGEKVSSIHEDQPLQTNESNEIKASENDQLKQLMAMVNYYNSVGRENRSKSTKTFRGASALAPGFSASMLPSLPETSCSSMEVSEPVMEQRPIFSPTSATATAPSAMKTATSPSIATSTQSLAASVKMEPLLHLGLSTAQHSLLPRNVSIQTSSTNSSSLLNHSSPAPSTLLSPSSSNNSLAVPSSMLTTPLMISTPSLTSSSTSSSPPDAVLSPAGLGGTVKSPPVPTEINPEDKRDNFTASSIFGDVTGGGNSALSASLSAALLSQPLFSQAMSHLTNSLTQSEMSSHTSSQNLTSMQTITSSTDSAASPLCTSPEKLHGSSENGSPNTRAGEKGSPTSLHSPNSNIHFPDNTDQLSDLIHIKQLTDVLGRKAVLDSLSPNISAATDLSQYLGSTISMAQAASLLGQLPTSTSNRNLLGSLCSMPLYNMDHELKTDGYSSLGNEVGLERSRNYQAAEQDTSNITLPEGFESEDHLTWSEVECFVNEFKTKRVKLGYTQAHVGAALALVHGPEFSQTTISRFEGLQLSFPNHKKIIPILRRWLESVENPTKRRHSSPNGLHVSNQNGNSKRRKRTTISSNSKEILEQYYQTNPLPSTEEIGNLSNNLALDKRVIRIWFQNRRAIGKRLSKLIVTMGGGATRSHSNQSSPMATMQQPQHGLF